MLWSPASVASDWVNNEARFAKEQRKLVPALIETASIPIEFKHVQAPDLTKWKGETDHIEFQKIVAGLRKPIDKAHVKPDDSLNLSKFEAPGGVFTGIFEEEGSRRTFEGNLSIAVGGVSGSREYRARAELSCDSIFGHEYRLTGTFDGIDKFKLEYIYFSPERKWLPHDKQFVHEMETIELHCRLNDDGVLEGNYQYNGRSRSVGQFKLIRQ